MKIFDGVEIQPTMSPMFTNTLSVMSLVARVVVEAQKCRDERLAFAANGGPKTPLEAVMAQAGVSIPTLNEALSKIVGISEGDPKGAEVEQITALLMNSPDLAGVLMALLQSGVNGPQKAADGVNPNASETTGPMNASQPSATVTQPHAPTPQQPEKPPQPPSGSWLPPQPQQRPAQREYRPPAYASSTSRPNPRMTGSSPAYATGSPTPMSASPHHAIAQPGHPIGAQPHRQSPSYGTPRSAPRWQSPRPPASGIDRWEELCVKLGLPGRPPDARRVPPLHREPPHPNPQSAAPIPEGNTQTDLPPSPTAPTATPVRMSTPSPTPAPSVPSERPQPTASTKDSPPSMPVVDMQALRIVEELCGEIRSSVESWKTAIDVQMSTAEDEMEELRAALAELVNDDDSSAPAKTPSADTVRQDLEYPSTESDSSEIQSPTRAAEQGSPEETSLPGPENQEQPVSDLEYVSHSGPEKSLASGPNEARTVVTTNSKTSQLEVVSDAPPPTEFAPLDGDNNEDSDLRSPTLAPLGEQGIPNGQAEVSRQTIADKSELPARTHDLRVVPPKQPAQAEQSESPHRVERDDLSEKSVRIAEHGHPDQPGTADLPSLNEQADQADQTEQAEQAEPPEQAMRPSQSEPSPQPGQPTKADQPTEPTKVAKPNHESESLDMTEKTAEEDLHDLAISAATPGHVDENPASQADPSPPRIDQLMLTDEANAYVRAYPERFNLRPMEIDALVKLAARAMSLTDERRELAEAVRKLKEQGSRPPVMRSPLCVSLSPSAVAPHGSPS